MLALLQFYQVFISPITHLGIPPLAVVGLWVGLRRAGLTPAARIVGIVTTGLLLAWYVTLDQLAQGGFYAAHWTVMRPLCWAVAVIWLIPLIRSESIGAALDAIPSWWLIGLQVYRSGGGLVWLANWAAGRLPTAFGLTVGIGDCLVEIFAVAVAVWVYFGARGGRAAGIAWNVYGLLDFAAGFIIASLLPYNLAYPAVMIPAFLAPLSLDFHGLSLRQLMAQSATTGKRICRLARRPPPEQSSATTVGAA